MATKKKAAKKKASRKKSQNRNGSGSRRGKTATQFKPGQSGNPGGRPKGFVRAIREKTNDGVDLVEFMLIIKNGKAPPGFNRTPTIKDGMEAVTWLADRGFGKPKQPLNLGIDDDDSEKFGEFAAAFTSKIDSLRRKA